MKANEIHQIFNRRCVQREREHAGERRFDDYLLSHVVGRPKSKNRIKFALKQTTIDQLIAAQGIFPVPNLDVFAGAIPDEDVDEFVADIYRDRKV